MRTSLGIYNNLAQQRHQNSTTPYQQPLVARQDASACPSGLLALNDAAIHVHNELLLAAILDTESLACFTAIKYESRAWVSGFGSAVWLARLEVGQLGRLLGQGVRKILVAQWLRVMRGQHQPKQRYVLDLLQVRR